MQILENPISGCLLIEPKCFVDSRGFFLETFQQERYREIGVIDNFVQDNHSRSTKNVLRGLHFQVINPQAKLVSVLRGAIFDVGVDVRKNSSTFGRWFGAILSDENHRQMYLASGFAHGFCVISDVADVQYKIGPIYDPFDENGILWNDPDIGIKWPVEFPIISNRDKHYKRLAETNLDNLPRVSL